MFRSAGMLILLCAILSGPLGIAEDDTAFPTGVWSCLIIAPRGVTEESLLIRFESGAPVAAESNLGGEQLLWRDLSYPRIDGYTIFFQEAGADRRFEGRFDGDGITGLWRSTGAVGEWWCAPVDAPDLRYQRADKNSVRRFPFPKAVRLTTPRYPREAIRNALEGRVVTCFKVDASGRIFDPVVLEQSDPIFREPTLVALGRSNFAAWPDGATEAPRPACRTYTFRLERDYH